MLPPGGAQAGVLPEATARVAPVPFRTLTWCGFLAWGCGAVASFHVAYEFYPPVIVLYLFCLYRLSHAAHRPQAMYAGWILGLLIYGPQLEFFHRIFGLGAIGLWLVLGTWLSLYLVLQRFALLRFGPRLGALAAPLLWTGLEYFRSELYILRFSWLNIGYVYGAQIPLHPLPPSLLFLSQPGGRSRWPDGALVFGFIKGVRENLGHRKG